MAGFSPQRVLGFQSSVLRSQQKGFTLVEVLVALALGVVLIIAAVSLIAPALKTNTAATSAQTIGALSKELSDNVRAWAGGNWNNVFSLATSSMQYYLNTSVSPFTSVGGAETVTVGSKTYQRYFTVSDVYRDSNGYVTSTSGGTNVLDPSTKSITVTAQAVTYDGTIGAWSTTTALSKTYTDHSAAAYNGYIYVPGGTQNGSAASTVNYAKFNGDGSISNWSSTTALPSAIIHHSTVAYNGYVYTTGGGDSSGNATTSTVSYAKLNGDGSISNWSSTTALPSSIDVHSAVAYNGYLYTTGGKNSSGIATTTVFYAPINSTGSIGTWSTTTQLPRTINNHSAVVNNGYIYIPGGIQTSGSATSTVSYAKFNGDGSISNWSSTTALPNAIRSDSAVVYNGYVYTVGGRDNSGATTTVYYAPINSDYSLGSWSNAAALPSAILSNSAVVYNGYVYTAGGENTGGTATSTVFFAKFNSTMGGSQTTSFLLTRNGNNAYVQSDWSGGSGQTGPATSTNNQFSTSTNVNASTTGSIFLVMPANTISFVQGTSSNCGSVTDCKVTFPSNTTAKNFYVVVLQVGALGGTITVTSTQSDTFTQAVTQQQTTDSHQAYIYYAQNVVGGAAAINAHISGAAASMRIGVHEYSGIASVNALDQATSTQGSGTSTASGQITTTQANELIFGGTSNSNTGGTLAAGSPYALRIHQGCGTGECLGSEDRNVTSTLTTSSTFTISPTTNWTGMIAGFKWTGTSAAVTGTLNSTVYDTGITTGAQLNSVLWQGAQNGGTVQFQFASSNSSSGPWSFIGPDNTGNTYFGGSTAPNTSISLVSTNAAYGYTLFNNYRYFQVRTYLQSNASGSASPIVNDVIVNWSP